jgi:nucleotide-binding universal stress UspA family protein
MKQKILVPLDGTPFGESILTKLQSLVFKNMPGTDIEVTLLRVISNLNYNVLTENKAAQLSYSSADLEEMTKREQVYLDGVAVKLRSNTVAVQTRIAVGNAAEEIVKVGQDIKANLIAMSSHGRSGVIRWAIGSVTDKVLRLEGKIPVLAVHPTHGAENTQVLAIDSLQNLVHHS